MNHFPKENYYISFVTETYKPEINGVANTLSNLVEGLHQLGHKLQVISPEQDNNQADDCNQANEPNNSIDNIRVSGASIPGYKELKFGFPQTTKLSKLWQYERPDIIYIATEGPLCWSAITVAKFYNIPLVSGFHTNFHTYSKYYRLGILKPLIIQYLKYFHNRTNMTLVPTIEMRTLLINLGVNNVEIMGRGVNTTLYSPLKRCNKLRYTWGLNDTDIAILYVGRIAVEKNAQLAIKSFREIQKINKNVKFIMVGDGPLSKKLKTENEDIIFCGMQTGEDLARHYASGDILLFPSETETFGNVITEAMASGLAIVAYNYAAAHIFLNNNECGITVQKGNEQDYIDQCVQLAQDTNLQKLYQTNARQASEDVSWNATVNRFLKLLLSTKQKEVTHEHKQDRTNVRLS